MGKAHAKMCFPHFNITCTRWFSNMLWILLMSILHLKGFGPSLIFCYKKEKFPESYDIYSGLIWSSVEEIKSWLFKQPTSVSCQTENGCSSERWNCRRNPGSEVDMITHINGRKVNLAFTLSTKYVSALY